MSTARRVHIEIRLAQVFESEPRNPNARGHGAGVPQKKDLRLMI